MTNQIINFFGGPGIGKSKFAAGLFYYLKCRNISCELLHEYAKDLVYADRIRSLNCQPYVFGKQLYQLETLFGQTDIIICDSPLLLSNIYTDDALFHEIVFEQFDKYRDFNRNYLLTRNGLYDTKGRKEDLEQAINIDAEIEVILNKFSIPYKRIGGSAETLQNVLNEVLEPYIVDISA